MSPFEILMLVCFGAAWPFSIYKSWRSREVAGKSVVFLFVIFAGYVSGAVHKVFYSFDTVIILYILIIQNPIEKAKWYGFYERIM